MRLAFLSGTLCADTSDELRKQFSKLGELIGIAHQLDNDSHDLYNLLQIDTSALTSAEVRSVKTDLVRRKKTLPVVLASRKMGFLQGTPLSDDEEKKVYLHAIHEGIIATWGICLLYRERARDCLQKIEAQKPIAPSLRFLLGFE